MERAEIITKIKSVITDCFPEIDVSAIEEDTVINTETSIDSMVLVLGIGRLADMFDIRIPARQCNKRCSLGDMANAIEKRLPKA